MVFLSSREKAIQDAKRILAQQPLYLDTETTGLSDRDEIVEISVIDSCGQTIFDQLVKPSRPIPPESTRLHGITNEMVRTAQPWPVVWNSMKPLVTEKLIAMYNDEFDIRMMRQSFRLYRFPWVNSLHTFDVMKCFAELRGEWNPIRQSYRFYKLSEAGAYFKISLPNAHRANKDSLLTKAVLEAIAAQ